MASLANPLFFAPVTANEVCYVSPSFYVPQASPQAGPVQRTRSRRFNRSSSDEHSTVSWDRFSEEDLRAGGPDLCEGPCETFYGIPQSHAYYSALTSLNRPQLERELLLLAREISPEIQDIRFCCRWSSMEKPENASLTVLFSAQRQVLTARGWIDAARKVRQRLHHKGLPQVKVEIVDPRFDQPLRPFPCFSNDDIYPIWIDVVKTIIRTLDVSDVYSLGCYRIGGNTRDTSSPTILIGISGKSSRDWKMFRESLVRTIDNLGLPTVGILLRRDSPVRNMNWNAISNSNRVAENCTPEVNLGSSLCPRQQEICRGTFGGWVELKNPKTGAWVPFGLTSAHCVLPTDVNTRAAEMLVIDSPSRSEIRSALDSIPRRINELRNNPTWAKVKRAHAEHDFVIPSEERAWSLANSSIKAEKNKQTLLKEYLDGRSSFGCVMAASGLKEKPLRTVQAKHSEAMPSILDWALIKPLNNLNRFVGRNKVCQNL